MCLHFDYHYSMLIPGKLPSEGPEIEIKVEGAAICRLYRMACTPPGFWSRLIARLLTRFSPETCSAKGNERRKMFQRQV